MEPELHWPVACRLSFPSAFGIGTPCPSLSINSKQFNIIVLHFAD
jgi:hypothetical protein